VGELRRGGIGPAQLLLHQVKQGDLATARPPVCDDTTGSSYRISAFMLCHAPIGHPCEYNFDFAFIQFAEERGGSVRSLDQAGRLHDLEGDQ